MFQSIEMLVIVFNYWIGARYDLFQSEPIQFYFCRLLRKRQLISAGR